MGLAIGWLAAAILAVSILYYAVVYTIWLKPRTPQNIVIGGGAGAFPPLIGWVAATGEITADAGAAVRDHLLLDPAAFLGARAVRPDRLRQGRHPDDAGGRGRTRRPAARSCSMPCCCCRCSLAPWWIGGTGAIYGVSALVLSGAVPALVACGSACATRADGDAMKPEKQLFAFSIIYLFALFAALVADRLVAGRMNA